MISDDVTTAVALARDTLAGATGLDWQVPAGTLEWTCWETVEHMSDDLFAYAGQLAPARPPMTTYVRFGWQRRREGGPALTVYTDPADGPAALLDVLEACGTLLAATVAFVPPDRLAYHPYGVSDASGFAAMGVVEVLVHMHDVATGLGLAFTPPADLCARVLRRLFPDAPAGGEPWPVLLDLTGRGPTKRDSWKWDGTPR